MTVWQRWCGICFQWRIEKDGRCTACGNAHMTGECLPSTTELEALYAAPAAKTFTGSWMPPAAAESGERKP